MNKTCPKQRLMTHLLTQEPVKNLCRVQRHIIHHAADALPNAYSQICFANATISLYVSLFSKYISAPPSKHSCRRCGLMPVEYITTGTLQRISSTFSMCNTTKPFAPGRL